MKIRSSDASELRYLGPKFQKDVFGGTFLCLNAFDLKIMLRQIVNKKNDRYFRVYISPSMETNIIHLFECGQNEA